jgi:hypothetical protein
VKANFNQQFIVSLNYHSEWRSLMAKAEHIQQPARFVP